MFLFGFFASPLPYILLMLFSMSGYAMVYLQGKSAVENDPERQENQQEYTSFEIPEKEENPVFYFSEIQDEIVEDQLSILTFSGFFLLIDPPLDLNSRKLVTPLLSRPPPAFSFL